MPRRLLLLAVLVTGCAGSAGMAPETLVRQLREDPAPLVVDVRSEAEYRRGHIPGAVQVPFWNTAAVPAALIEACRRRPVVVTCEHGPRAEVAAAGLRRRGCPDVRLLEGHMARWRTEGRPMTAPGR